MVYRGRPSTGCLKCRQRKIKCDEKPGGCVKCAEKNLECPGYENTIDRFFQDESAHVEQKAKTAKAKAIALRDQRELKAKEQRLIEKSQQSIEAPLLGPLIDQGISFFMSNYAIGLDQPPVQSDLYHRHLTTHGFHPIIATSMTAMGLAGIANICMDPNFRREATRWYLKALQMTNTALASPRLVKSDNTLLATMILCMFEATSNEYTLAGWSNHVKGSASLLKMRGRKQFSTPAGRWMYQHTVAQLTMNCFGRGEPLPDYVLDMNEESRKHENSRHPANRFQRCHIEVINFRADILQGRLFDLKETVDRALELDAMAKSVFENVDPLWLYETEYIDHPIPGVFGSYYHIYAHMASAQTWNWVRYTRIYLHDIIRNSIILSFSMSPPPLVGEKYTNILHESTTTLYQLQADILASVPQHMHDTPKAPLRYERETTPKERSSPFSDVPIKYKFFWSNFREQMSSTSRFSPEAASNERLPIIRVSGGYTGLWALYVAGATSIATPESQDFVLQSLFRIENEFGISQGKVLANALKLKIQMDKSGEHPFQIVPTYLPEAGEHYEDLSIDGLDEVRSQVLTH